MPRRVLRHLVSAAGLGLRSRVLVGGDAAEPMCDFLTGLGIDASREDSAIEGSPFDAAIWLELGTSDAYARSLLASESIRRSFEMTRAIRADGTFLFVCRIDEQGSSHNVGCVERHLASLGATPHLAVFPERAFSGFLGGNTRTTYAVSTCRAASCSNERIAASTADLFGQEACCQWADRRMNRNRAA
ncbi:MAG: hypothetical protein M3552_21045 [Planctomycetota bacterium]|nr:hypothetical protein [Planctomycetaceae bacterium]MDQ3333103.1 hypothetical protein [Planctomycetota bacterium]